MTIEKWLADVYYDEFGTHIWNKADGGSQLIAEIRGWGRLQNEFKTEEEAAKFQDEVGEFIVQAIKEKLERTYGSKGSETKTDNNNMKTGTSRLMDSHLVDFTNPNANNIKSGSTTSSQTEPAMIIPEAISILKIHQQWRLGADRVMIESKELTKAIDVLINYHIGIMNEIPTFSQTEISDEEILKQGNYLFPNIADVFRKDVWEMGAKWYREQLKQL